MWEVVWDFLMIEGSNALIRAGYAIMELSKNDLLETSNFGLKPIFTKMNNMNLNDF